MSDKIRDITGMCHLISELNYKTDIDNDECGSVTVHGIEEFDGTIEQCYDYISLYKRMAKHKQVADLLEEICRGNIEALNEWQGFGCSKQIAQNWKKEIEAVILSDDEVNERAIKEQQG